MSDDIHRLLTQFDTHPILVDIGASAGSPPIWNAISPYSIYVGFDPDLREIYEEPLSRFYKKWIINEAVTADPNSDSVTFYFTRSPYCSSTLKPDADALAEYWFSDLFAVERQAQVRAAALDSVLTRLALPGIDWLKVDSQGTDLRIFESLSVPIRSRVLALDIEPGLIDAYVGEDLFVEAHRVLTRNGFWLSDLEIGKAIRLKRSTLEQVSAWQPKIDAVLVESAVRTSPAYCEARYLRTLHWLSSNALGQREYVLLYSFALLDNQVGFALDLAGEYERTFGKDDILPVLYGACFSRLRRARVKAWLKSPLRTAARRFVPLRVRQWSKRMTLG